MARSKYMELDNITLVGWVDKALNHSFTKHNITSGFKVTHIWPYNPKAMDNTIQHSNIYTITSNNAGGERITC